MALRQGDLYIFNTNDGGEIEIKSGEPVMDAGLETAVYMSLFLTESADHWINEYAEGPEKVTGEFYRFIKGAPKTSDTLNTASELAFKDLQWMISFNVADEILISISSVDRNHVELSVKILKDENTLLDSVYTFNWQSQEKNPAHGRI